MKSEANQIPQTSCSILLRKIKTWALCIKAKDTGAPTEAALKVDPDPQEADVEDTMEATEKAPEETKTLVKIRTIERTITKTITILKQNPKINKHLLLTKEVPMATTMVEEEQPLLDSRARQESGVQIVAKSRTTQLNVGATRRKLSTT